VLREAEVEANLWLNVAYLKYNERPMSNDLITQKKQKLLDEFKAFVMQPLCDKAQVNWSEFDAIIAEHT